MSRLDRHVHHVQNKLAVRQFVHALAWTALALACAVALVVLVLRVVGFDQLPRARWWLIGAGVAVAGVGAFAMARRPRAHDAAIAIDERLNLNEKFSTALFARGSKDPFAQAAVRDAEATADQVNLNEHFPVAFPRVGYGALAAIALAFGVGLWMPALDLFSHREEAKKKEAERELAQGEAKRKVEQAIVAAQTLPRALAEDPKFKADIKQLKDLLNNQHMDDPAHANRKSDDVLRDVQQALADEAAKVHERMMQQEKTFTSTFGDPADYKSEEVKQVDKDLSQAKFDKAVADFGKMAGDFDKKKPEEKEQIAKDVAKLAQKLANQANDPKVQKDIQDKLQQMGVSAQQSQQIAQQMQQAAQGDKQAQQQLAQQAQQLQQQLQQQVKQAQQQAAAGNQQAQQQAQQAQQQLNALQQAMQGMQGQANAQAQAQQMAQAAQQMAQAMQQQAQAQQGGQQQQGAQQSGQQQQGQAGQQGQASAQQQMQNAQQQMQQAMGAMQAAQADAQQIADAQQQAMRGSQQGGQEGQGGKDGKGNGGEGAQAQRVPGNQGKGNQGEWDQGDPAQNQGNGMGGPGIGNGGSGQKTLAGFKLKTEHDIGDENEKGKILANTLIKDNKPVRGESKLGLAQVSESAQKQESDEVDEEHVSGQSRKAAEEYFRTMARESKK